MRRWVHDANPEAQLAAEGSAWRAFGGLAFWTLRLVLDVPGTVAGLRRWVLAAAPVAPGIRADLSAEGGPQALAPGERDATAEEGKDQEAERLPGEHDTDQEPHEQAKPPAPDAPTRTGLAPGETKRHALIRLYCGQTGDPRDGNRAKTAELAGEIAAQIGYHAGTARRELAKYLASRSAAVQDPETKTGYGAAEVA